MARNLSCFLFKRSKAVSLGLVVPVGNVDQNYVITKILEKVEELEREKHAVLFLLDNVDRFTAGKGKEWKNLKTASHGIFSQALRGQKETISFKAFTHLQDRVKRSQNDG